MFLFQLQKIIRSNLLTFLQELVVLDWQCKILVENVFLQANGKQAFKKLIEVPFGDITKARIKNYIPQEFDILCAGFPCQAFSIAGNQKGFADTRGTLFFDIEQIVVKHRPKVVFLENVKNLVSHDNGNTFKTIISVLEDKLGYKVFTKILNSMKHANIPQNRERIFIVAFNPNQVKKIRIF